MNAWLVAVGPKHGMGTDRSSVRSDRSAATPVAPRVINHNREDQGGGGLLLILNVSSQVRPE